MKKTEHKTAIKAAFTAYVTATATLAQVVQAALADGCTPAEIREWASEVCSPSHVSRTLNSLGVRQRGKRSDAGKAREADEAVGETLSILADLFTTASTDGEPESEDDDGDDDGAKARKPVKFSLDRVAKRIHEHCNGNTKRIASVLTRLQKALAKLAAE